MGGVSEGRGQGRGELETRDTEKLCVGGVRKGRGQERWELAGIGRKDGLEEGNLRRIGKRGGYREIGSWRDWRKAGTVWWAWSSPSQPRPGAKQESCIYRPSVPTGSYGTPGRIGRVCCSHFRAERDALHQGEVCRSLQTAKGCLPKCKQQVSPPVHPFYSGGPQAGPWMPPFAHEFHTNCLPCHALTHIQCLHGRLGLLPNWGPKWEAKYLETDTQGQLLH